MNKYPACIGSSQLTLVDQSQADLGGNIGCDNPAIESDLCAKEDERRESCLDCSKKANTALYLPADKSTGTSPEDNFKPTAKAWIKEKCVNFCTTKNLMKRVPICSWLPRYNVSTAVSDLVAGVTVGLTIIPQAIAYANVAGMPPQVGLYSSFMGCFIYTILGSVKDSAIGPTAISGLLARENVHEYGVDGAVVLCLLSGIVQLLMGCLQLGFLIDFISGPVSIGFTSAAAIIIATTQVKDILGLSFSASNFLHVWENIFLHIHETKLWDVLLGVSCMVIILLLRKSKDFQVGPSDIKDRKRIHDYMANTIWLVSTARNIIVVICCAVLAYYFESRNVHPFKLTGQVKPGLPEFKPPPFEITVGNKTHNFIEMTSTMGSALIVVPLLGILENIALAKVFSDGKAIDATQEMLALGVCNIASSFVGSMPITSALSRGAVNNASGVETTFGGIYTGLIVIVSLQFFTPYFYFIPKASLAAVIIAAVVFMVELQVIKPIWRTKKSDLIPATATFLSCLFLRLEIGIAIGISINLLSLLYASARPSVGIEKLKAASGVEYLLITPDRSLAFPSVEYVRANVSKAGVKHGSSSVPVVIDARHIQGADFTAAKGIKLLIEDFSKRNQQLLFFNLKPSVISIFEGLKPKGFKYCRTYLELEGTLKRFSTANDTTDGSNGVSVVVNKM